MEAYIYDSVRTPRGIGKKTGSLSQVSPVQLTVTLLNALKTRNNLDTSLVEDVILGCVTQAGEQGGNIAKVAAQVANYGNHLAAVSLNRYCASGLEAVNQAAARIRSGWSDLIIAGGVESMSRVPMGIDGSAWVMEPDAAFGKFVPQGISADLIATKYGYSRKDLDAFALISQQRATAARSAGNFKKSIIPVTDINGFTHLDHDEYIREKTTLEGLANLRPAFQKMGEMLFNQTALDTYTEIEQINHVHHAGNSSGIVDGAALMLIGSKEVGEKLGLKPRAKIKMGSIIGSEPLIMLEGPTPATKKALQKANMEASDIDLWEINEAFAVVPLRLMENMKIDHSIVNINGGAIAMGHPLGATGCMILGTALDELERQNKQTALATLCVGGGMGIATIIERI
ncbi:MULTISPECIES: acetyl-CoA C-acetyltransferase [unclassified Tenacibaculum]|uniref:acetyl-CoA C-acetyltransferase n=1 Tax=unclassified Tenacibaculum TaxID=2635139 RepID=UPI001F3909C1|nr:MULTISPECIES: acetyl-CoA C-acetyltransferase [unclassified Tenacibaculum]MCF2876458.1 acetyl-CoA C-acetyltransferase [Tenacibaculum sp. Cn5-1]MCF2936635.1 acetyl-CoA C-acetyltransferase [Tenacibaculum sp. Cn5-34]MCG7511772.1 acetyl-CoA C-acetyltransferase [Tenacibaculum sp. Cn5-46]